MKGIVSPFVLVQRSWTFIIHLPKHFKELPQTVTRKKKKRLPTCIHEGWEGGRILMHFHWKLSSITKPSHFFLISSIKKKKRCPWKHYSCEHLLTFPLIALIVLLQITALTKFSSPTLCVVTLCSTNVGVACQLI